ncbi:MAG: DUF58 domain-containing protein [Thermomicrobium sp.]|nr:DUF58 domain-containing protein [Thermomicrobium sp.]
MDDAPVVVPLEREEFLPAGLALATVLGFLGVALDRPVLALVAFAVALVLALGLLYRRFGFARVRYWRTVAPTQVFPGETVTLELALENGKPLPLVWVETVEEVPAVLDLAGVRLEPSPKPGRKLLRTLLDVGAAERVSRRYQARPMRRGYYRLGPSRLTTGDPFGLARARLDVEPAGAFLVYPELRPVESFGLPAERPLGDAAPLRPLLDDPLRIQGVRPYQPGDSPRQIHWRASARLGELQTRLLERTATPALALFLDVNTFEHFWEGIRPGELEWAISLTASLAAWGIEQGYQVGLWVNAPLVGGERFIRILPGRHPRQLQRILEALAMLIPHTGHRIETVLGAETRLLQGGVTVVVVTALVTDTLRRTLVSLWRQGYGVALLAVDCEAGLPSRRGLVVYELEASRASAS